MTSNKVRRLRKTESRFFYGYVVVVIAFFVMVVSWGIYNAFGVFFKPLQAEFGWSSAMTSGAFSLSMIIYGVMGIAVGGLNDRFGPRIVMTACGILLGLGYLLTSQISALWQIYLFFGVIAGIGLSGVWVPQLSTVARWFVRRRSLMSGIVVAGVGVGQLVGPLVISHLIMTYDWRLSYIILGSIILVVMVFAAQFMRRDPARMGQLPYGENEVSRQELTSEGKSFSLREAVHTSQFWIAITMFFCYGFCAFGITVHIVPHIIDLGISPVVAATVLATMGGTSILGTYVMGGLGDKIGNRQVCAIGFILMAVSLFGLVLSREAWMLYLFVSIIGLGVGGMGAVESPMVAWLFGLRFHGLIYGVAHLGFTAGAAIGPFLMGYIFDITSGYGAALLTYAAIAIAGLILSVVLRPRKVSGM